MTSSFDRYNNTVKRTYRARANSCAGPHRWIDHPKPDYEGQKICKDCPMTGQKLGNHVIPDCKLISQ